MRTRKQTLRVKEIEFLEPKPTTIDLPLFKDLEGRKKEGTEIQGESASEAPTDALPA